MFWEGPWYVAFFLNSVPETIRTAALNRQHTETRSSSCENSLRMPLPCSNITSAQREVHKGIDHLL